jgi:radical SAM superfamily enzyme
MIPQFLNWQIEALPLDDIKCKHIHIFGEIHTNEESVKTITDRIRALKPTVILHELAYSDKCLTKEQLEARIKGSRIGGKCDPELNQDVYELALELGAKLIGIDTSYQLGSVNNNTKFTVRETHMYNMIMDWGHDAKDEMICVVVGDTHLRSAGVKGDSQTTLKTASIIYTKLKNNPKVTINRADKHMREVE